MKLRQELLFGGSHNINYVSNKIYTYRHKINNTRGGVFCKLLRFRYDNYMRKNACSIPLEVKLGEGINFPHFSGIFISSAAKIGNNCTIFQQVTIGSNTLKDSIKQGSPVIGDNCYIGAGAKIIGNIVVGNNCRIGANCIIVTNIPDNSTVVMNPARIIEHDIACDNSFMGIEDIKHMTLNK